MLGLILMETIKTTKKRKILIKLEETRLTRMYSSKFVILEMGVGHIIISLQKFKQDNTGLLKLLLDSLMELQLIFGVLHA